MTAPLHNFVTKQKVMAEMKHAYDTSDLFGAPCTGSRRLFVEYFDRLLSVSHDYMDGNYMLRRIGAGLPY